MAFFTSGRDREHASQAALKRRTSRRAFRPRLEILEDRTLLSVNFPILANDLRTTVQTMATAVHTALAAADSIPLIGTQLQKVDALTVPLDQIANNLGRLTNINQIAGSLGPLVVGPVTVSQNGSNLTVEALLHLNVAATPVSDFDLGLGNFLKIQSTGGFSVQVGFDYLLQFTDFNDQSVALGDQFGRVANLSDVNRNLPAVPLALNISTQLGSSGTPFKLEATLNGLLHATATDLGGSGLNNFFVGLALNAGAGVSSAVVGGDARANLHLALEFAPDSGLPINPQLAADFHMDWSFSSANADGAPSSFGTLSTLAFDSVSFNVGLSLPSFLRPIIADLQKLTMPLEPIVALTEQELPILSSFGVHETIRDLLDQTGALPSGIGNAIDAIDLINHLTPSGVGSITLGDFNLSPNGRQDAFGSVADIISSVVPAGLYAQANADTGGLLDMVQSQKDTGLQFPILDDPKNAAFQLLMGQPVTLFKYTMPTLNIPLQATAGVDLGVLGLYLRGFIDTKIDLSVGYDTTGLAKAAKDLGKPASTIIGDVLDGFYIDNTPIPETDNQGTAYIHYKTGVDIQGGLYAGASFGVTITGGVFANVSAHLNYSSPLVRLDQIWATLSTNPLSIFALHGEVYAEADISLGIHTPLVSFDLFKFTLAKVVVVDFDTSAQGQSESGGPGTTYADMIPIYVAPGDNTITVCSYTDVSQTPGGALDAWSGIEVIYADHKSRFPTTHNINGQDVFTRTCFIVTDFGSNTAPTGNHTIIVDPSIVETYRENGNTLYAANETIWTGVSGLLFGGPGDDHLEWSAPGQGTLVGGGGNDDLIGGTVEYAGFAPANANFGDTSKVNPATLSQLMASQTGSGLGNTNLIAGPTPNSRFYGGPGNNNFQIPDRGPGIGRGDQLIGGTGNNWFDVPSSAGLVYVSGDLRGYGGDNTLHVFGSASLDSNVFGGGTSANTVTVTASVSALTITEQQYYGSLTCIASRLTALDIEPRTGKITVNLPDLSTLGLRGVTVDLGANFVPAKNAPVTAPVNQVILHGSNFSDRFNVASYDLNEVLISYHTGADVSIDEPIMIRGLNANDNLVLDGAGLGNDTYNIELDSSMVFTTAIRPTSKGNDSLIVDGSNFKPYANSDNISVTNTMVAFADYYAGSLEASAFVTFDTHVSNLTVIAADKTSVASGSAITVNRPNTSAFTTVYGGNGDDVFTVLAGANLTLDGKNGNNEYDLSPTAQRMFSGSSGDLITVTDSGTSGFNTLVLNDPDNPTYGSIVDVIAAESILRSFGRYYLDTIMYTHMDQLTIHAAAAPNGDNYIRIESTAAATATTVQTSTGTSYVQMTPAGQNLDLVAGMLTVNGGPGLTYLSLADQANPSTYPGTTVLTVDESGLSRTSVANRYIVISGIPIPIPVVYTESIRLNNVSALTLNVPRTALVVYMARSNVYRVGATLSRAALATHFVLADSVLPPINFTNTLFSLAINESSAGDTLNVFDTPSCPTTLGVGYKGYIHVYGTTGPVDIEATASGAPGAVDLGNPVSGGVSLSSFHGAVTVGNTSAALALGVDYRADTGVHHAVLTGGQIAGAAPVTIGVGIGVQLLTIHSGGDNGSDVTIAGSPGGATVVLHGGAGETTVHVQADTAPVEIDSGPGKYSVFVTGSIDSLDDIVGPLTVNGIGGGATSLMVDDRNNQSAFLGRYFYITHPTYVITNSTITRSNLTERVAGGVVAGMQTAVQTIAYSYLNTLSIDGGPSDNVFDIQSTAAGTSTTVNTGVKVGAANTLNPGNDAINVGSAANTLNGIVGSLTLEGKGGTVPLTVNDQGASGFLNYAVTAGGITRAGAAPINYDFMSALMLNTAAVGGTATDVQSTDIKTPVTVNTSGLYVSTVNVGTPSNLLRNIVTLTVNGGAGGPTVLNLNDQANADGPYFFMGPATLKTRPTYVVTDHDVIRSDDLSITPQRSKTTSTTTIVATINYQNIASLAINGGTSPNIFNIQGTAAGTTTTVNAGKAADQIIVGSAANTMDGLLGTLLLNGQGNTVLHVDDQATTADRTYSLSATDLIRSVYPAPESGGQDVAYGGMATVVIRGGSGTNLFNVTGTPIGTAVTLYGGTANSDQFVVGDNSRLDSIMGPLTLYGQTALSFAIFSDLANASGQTYSLSGGTLQRTGMAQIAFDALDQIVLYTGSAADTVNVASTLAATPVSIFTGGGNDTINVSPVAHDLGNIAGSLNFAAIAGIDTLNLDDQATATADGVYLISASSVSRPGTADVTFSNIKDVSIYTRRGRLPG
jgi:hypothetical protein